MHWHHYLTAVSLPKLKSIWTCEKDFNLTRFKETNPIQSDQTRKHIFDVSVYLLPQFQVGNVSYDHDVEIKINFDNLDDSDLTKAFDAEYRKRKMERYRHVRWCFSKYQRYSIRMQIIANDKRLVSWYDV